MRMRIGICDDVPEMCDMLRRQIEEGNYTTEPLEITCFHNACELLDSCQPLDALFLDIEMPEMSGMQLMHEHSSRFLQTKVIFLTSHTEYALEGYEVQAYRFLQKPAEDHKLRELFHALEDELILSRTITFHASGEDVSIRLGDIIYAEVRNNYTSIFTTQCTFECYMRLKNLWELLPEKYFYQPHKAFLINLTHVKSFDIGDRFIILTNGYKAEVAFRKRAEFKERYSEFLLQH